jgi:hypothetical protein
MKPILLIILLGVGYPGLGQNKSHPYSVHKKTADSILTLMIDEGVFNKHVRFAAERSYYVKLNDVSQKKIDFHQPLNFKPDFYTFSYDFSHPAFSGHIFPLVLTLDVNGKFVADRYFHGFVIVSDLMDSTIVSKEKAIKSLKAINKPGYRIDKSSMKLVWDSVAMDNESFVKTGDVRDLARYNSIAWRVNGTIIFERNKKKYRGYFQMNALTGEIAEHFAVPWD